MPTLASYCTTFLKPEMLHIYRQITAVDAAQEFEHFVICKERREEARYPFDDVEIQPQLRSNFLRRFYLKYLKQEAPIIYRGEYQVLANILKRRQVDLLHVYFGHTGVHLLPILKRWQAEGGKAVVSFHGMDVQPRKNQPGYEQKLRELLQTCPRVLARSESLQARLLELGAPEQNIRLNRTGIPLEKFPFQVREAPQDGQWKLVQACRFIEKKGLPTTLKAFAQFLQVFPKAQLTLAGEGPLEAEIKDLAKELQITKNIHWAGFLGEEALNELYANSHLLLHPSQLTADQNQEGVPNAMLEAMATGLPVLATEHGGIPEAVTHGQSGFLVAEKDHQALASYLIKLAQNPSQWQSMSSQASKEVRAKFSRENSTQALLNIYQEVLTSSSH